MFIYCSIDAEETIGHICQLVNDGPDDKANAVMKMKTVNGIEHLCLFARRKIVEGEEILYNYGDEENLWWRKEVRLLLNVFCFIKICGCIIMWKISNM